ncbi:MAG: hypothetical protein MJ247_04230 [Alphaproteobacteria bacterium]|nr:hypothetical protein [Alphaproteobacteria bacterium]
MRIHKTFFIIFLTILLLNPLKVKAGQMGALSLFEFNHYMEQINKEEISSDKEVHLENKLYKISYQEGYNDGIKYLFNELNKKLKTPENEACFNMHPLIFQDQIYDEYKDKEIKDIKGNYIIYSDLLFNKYKDCLKNKELLEKSLNSKLDINEIEKNRFSLFKANETTVNDYVKINGDYFKTIKNPKKDLDEYNVLKYIATKSSIEGFNDALEYEFLYKRLNKKEDKKLQYECDHFVKTLTFNDNAEKYIYKIINYIFLFEDALPKNKQLKYSDFIFKTLERCSSTDYFSNDELFDFISKNTNPSKKKKKLFFRF